MKILVVGASGATGKLLVEQLVNHGEDVHVIIRTRDSFPEFLRNHKNVDVTIANLLELSDNELKQHVKDCDAVVSCLGHNLNFKGIYGQPRRLVTDATRRLCEAIKANKPQKITKFILMNTTGNSNRDLQEQISLGQKFVTGLIRLLLPPHVDNEMAADYLRTNIGQNNNTVEWAAVRPDGLIDEDEVTNYELHPSPIRSAIFDSGKTSRINVGHFMADLITNQDSWSKWKGRMPVIYNKV